MLKWIIIALVQGKINGTIIFTLQESKGEWFQVV